MIGLFRVDSYPEVGMGHIVRSISIADHLRSRKKNLEIIFFGFFDSNAQNLLKKNNLVFIHQVNLIEFEEEPFQKSIFIIKPQIIIFDKLFDYSKEFIQTIREISKIIMIHNICEGSYYTHKMILPSAHTDSKITKSEKWLNGLVDFYYGPKYILINDHIKKLMFHAKKRDIKNIIITTGGSDPKGVLISVLKMLQDNKFKKMNFIALVGKSFIQHEELRNIMITLPENIKIKKFNYKYLNIADLAISTFGVTTYELIYLNIPTISIGHCTKNALGSKNLSDNHKNIIDLGLIDDLKKEKLITTIDKCIINNEKIEQLKNAMLGFIDGNGIQRITDIVIN